MTAPDPAAIAKGLTKAQRALVMALDGKEYRNWKALTPNVKTRDAVAKAGLAWFDDKGPVHCYFMRRLSPLGLAVRAHLENSHD